METSSNLHLNSFYPVFLCVTPVNRNTLWGSCIEYLPLQEKLELSDGNLTFCSLPGDASLFVN